MAKGERKGGRKGAKAKAGGGDGSGEARGGDAGDGGGVASSTTPIRLNTRSVAKLMELARIEQHSSAAEAFDKHFGPQLDHLLIAAAELQLKRLREAAES